MRSRDKRAIAFWVGSTLLILISFSLLSGSWIVSIALASAYNAWLLTRARMRRVLARLRGDIDWSGYHRN